jgi:hypothetical protein
MIMNARSQPPFPPNPQPGQKWGAWTWTGSRWACTRLQGVFVNVQTFPASAPYTPTPGLTSLTVECWGAGGGGGGALAGTTFVAMGGGGGGSGGYSRVTLPASLVLGGVNVTIGAGGPGGTTGPVGSGGTDGGVTSFGALCIANGGSGGKNALDVLTSGYGGAGAAPGLGDIAFAGNAGQTGGYVLVAEEVEVVGGQGGAAPLGGGVAAEAATLANSNVTALGGAGMSPGAGGGGASSANAAATPAGGAGAGGFCLVTETCWADTGDEGDCGCGPTGGQARIAAWPGGYDD